LFLVSNALEELNKLKQLSFEVPDVTDAENKLKEIEKAVKVTRQIGNRYIKNITKIICQTCGKF
jgi:hypothetical protein